MRDTWTPFPRDSLCPSRHHLASNAALPVAGRRPRFLLLFQMTAFGEWASQEGRCTIRKRWSAKAVAFFFPGALSGMCHRRWGRGPGEQRVSTRHRRPGNKMSEHSFQNLMKTSIFIKSKGRGPQRWDILSCFKTLEKQWPKCRPSSKRQWILELDDVYFQHVVNLPIAIILKQGPGASAVSEPAWSNWRASGRSWLFQVHVQWCHAGSLSPTTVAEFTSRNWAGATSGDLPPENQPTSAPPLQLVSECEQDVWDPEIVFRRTVLLLNFHVNHLRKKCMCTYISENLCFHIPKSPSS